MCRVTSTSPPPSFASKRSSLSTSSSSSSIRSTDSNGLPKRVSFCDRVEVYKLEPLEDKEQIFYCSHDYRRFRSDQTLELLDEQLKARAAALKRSSKGKVQALFRVLIEKLTSPVAKQRRLLQREFSKQPKKPSVRVEHLPWMTPYHPHEEEETKAEQAYEENSTASKSTSSREQDLIQELAFFG